MYNAKVLKRGRIHLSINLIKRFIDPNRTRFLYNWRHIRDNFIYVYMALRLNDTTNTFAYAHLPDIIYSRLRHFAGQGTEIGRDRYSEAELTDIKREALKHNQSSVRFSRRLLYWRNDSHLSTLYRIKNWYREFKLKS